MDADEPIPCCAVDTEGSKDASRASGLQYGSPEALYQAERDRLVRTLAVIAGDVEAAKEAVQDAFVEACLRWSEVVTYEHQVAWLRRVSLNRLHDRRRSLLRRASALLRLGSSPRNEVASEGASTRLDLARGLADLPVRQRTAIVLFYVGDLSVAEVAEAMRVSEGSVKRHLHRGREALRRYLEVE